MAFLNEQGLERLWAHIVAKLGNKVDKVSGQGLSTNDYTDEEKSKLAGIADGATNIVVDDALLDTSENPVQNKVINEAIVNINTIINIDDTTLKSTLEEVLV